MQPFLFQMPGYSVLLQPAMQLTLNYQWRICIFDEKRCAAAEGSALM